MSNNQPVLTTAVEEVVTPAQLAVTAIAQQTKIFLLKNQQSTSGDDGCRRSSGFGNSASAASGRCKQKSERATVNQWLTMANKQQWL